MTGPSSQPRVDSAPSPQEAPRDIGKEEARAILRALFAQWRVKLLGLVRASVAQCDDLFETHSHIPDGEIEIFRKKRGEWVDKFDKTLCDLFDRRVEDGVGRQGRRPDQETSLATLRVLTAFDHDRQEALKDATRFLDRFTKREIAALDLRVEALLGEPGPRDVDNPFAVSYILDAVGSSARAVFSNPRIWRPFMERVLADLTPEINKLYISLNRFLADRGVLPEIKAALRARSELRPDDDRDLLPTFSKLMKDALPGVPRDVVVPETLADPNAPPSLVFADSFASRPAPVHAAMVDPNEMSAAKILAGLAALAASPAAFAASGGMAAPSGVAASAPVLDASGFPSLDPLMALGTSTPLFATLAHWQRLDLPTAIAAAAPKPAPGSPEGMVVPLNLIPHIRAAIEDQISNDTDRITMDVIALLFDYIFRDKSIPDSLRNLFSRLQVPIVKAALLDRAFFSDRKHPARQLLDRLAEAAVGANQTEAYQDSFAHLASGLVDDICRDFEIDVGVFRTANLRLAAFIEDEGKRVEAATSQEVAQALASEEVESDRSHVRAFMRDRLAGLDLPFEIRGFAETTWADYMAKVRAEQGPDSEAWKDAVKTLDDMLWSITAKDRSAQKAQLTKMIPKLIGALRKGSIAAAVPPERGRAFFEALYQLHIAAIKSAAAAEGGDPKNAVPATTAVNVHDYVSEMAVGTWLALNKEGETINARLTWVSPLRTKYLFTSRSRARAFVYTPEELAFEIEAGQVSLLVEPVPLFDRAVSAALNELGARQPPQQGARPAALAPA